MLQNEVGEAVLNIHIQELETRSNVTIFGPEEGHFTINIQVSRVTRNSQGKASVPYSENTVKLSKDEIVKGRWVKINVTNMVAEFFRLPRENLAVIVKVQDPNNRVNVLVPHPSAENSNALENCDNPPGVRSIKTINRCTFNLRPCYAHYLKEKKPLHQQS
ncbi:hypothetical protein EVAR_14416_1 [Eumeta japonica]|uniref:Uncharacterized protein n=1 Tax=Eumeta variegata TaxID=151549 RepID=A0A4C1TYH4_EUMVA|nr:hypothetical protein EVAR_14416_1 [Eumeta japonica]